MDFSFKKSSLIKDTQKRKNSNQNSQKNALFATNRPVPKNDFYYFYQLNHPWFNSPNSTHYAYYNGYDFLHFNIQGLQSSNYTNDNVVSIFPSYKNTQRTEVTYILPSEYTVNINMLSPSYNFQIQLTEENALPYKVQIPTLLKNIFNQIDTILANQDHYFSCRSQVSEDITSDIDAYTSCPSDIVFNIFSEIKILFDFELVKIKRTFFPVDTVFFIFKKEENEVRVDLHCNLNNITDIADPLSPHCTNFTSNTFVAREINDNVFVWNCFDLLKNFGKKNKDCKELFDFLIKGIPHPILKSNWKNTDFYTKNPINILIVLCYLSQTKYYASSNTYQNTRLEYSKSLFCEKQLTIETESSFSISANDASMLQEQDSLNKDNPLQPEEVYNAFLIKNLPKHALVNRLFRAFEFGEACSNFTTLLETGILGVVLLFLKNPEKSPFKLEDYENIKQILKEKIESGIYNKLKEWDNLYDDKTKKRISDLVISSFLIEICHENKTIIQDNQRNYIEEFLSINTINKILKNDANAIDKIITLLPESIFYNPEKEALKLARKERKKAQKNERKLLEESKKKIILETQISNPKQKYNKKSSNKNPSFNFKPIQPTIFLDINLKKEKIDLNNQTPFESPIFLDLQTKIVEIKKASSKKDILNNQLKEMNHLFKIQATSNSSSSSDSISISTSIPIKVYNFNKKDSFIFFDFILELGDKIKFSGRSNFNLHNEDENNSIQSILEDLFQNKKMCFDSNNDPCLTENDITFKEGYFELNQGLFAYKVDYLSSIIKGAYNKKFGISQITKAKENKYHILFQDNNIFTGDFDGEKFSGSISDCQFNGTRNYSLEKDKHNYFGIIEITKNQNSQRLFTKLIFQYINRNINKIKISEREQKLDCQSKTINEILDIVFEGTAEIKETHRPKNANALKLREKFLLNKWKLEIFERKNISLFFSGSFIGNPEHFDSCFKNGTLIYKLDKGNNIKFIFNKNVPNPEPIVETI